MHRSELHAAERPQTSAYDLISTEKTLYWLLKDALDSITTDLLYRSARSLKAARVEIDRWSGRQFDPEIVKVFLEMPDNIWEDLQREVDRNSAR